MMNSKLHRLVSIASGPLGTAPPHFSDVTSQLGGVLSGELFQLLTAKNGFYAFESALHVFAASPQPHGFDLNSWNSPETWRFAYEDLTEDCVFFAEDVFGGQFCIWRDEVYSFDPETGEKDRLASSLDDWAGLILADYRVLTGYPLAHEWQQLHGALPQAQRLIPKQPFALGGPYSVDNLYALDAVKGMRFRGDLACQLKNLPDGATVRLKTID